MPFRDKPFPRRLHTLLLPVFAVSSLALIIVWTVWALSILPGGWQHATAGVVLLLAGFDGIAAFIVLASAVVVVIIEAALYDARSILNAEILQLLARIAPKPEGPKEEEEHHA